MAEFRCRPAPREGVAERAVEREVQHARQQRRAVRRGHVALYLLRLLVLVGLVDAEAFAEDMELRAPGAARQRGDAGSSPVACVQEVGEVVRRHVEGRVHAEGVHAGLAYPVAVALAQWINALPQRRYTYRILFVPETIGAIVYLSRHLAVMKKNTVAGFVLTCMGDDRAYSYVASRLGDTLADRVAKHVLSYHAPQYQAYSFLDRGSDERQYCSPGVDLPVCSVIRSKYGTYPEYHTSSDDLSLISPQGLQGGFDAVRKCLEILENNYVYETAVPCEPQLGKRGLYPTLSAKDTKDKVRHMMDFLAYADGTKDLIGIAETIGVNAKLLIPIATQLLEHKILRQL